MTDDDLDDDVKSVDELLPEQETLKEISEALYNDVKAEYVDVLDDKAHDTLHAAIHYIGVFYQLLEKRDEERGVRGRREVREKLNDLVSRQNTDGSPYFYKRLGKIEGLQWCRKERDEL